MIRKGNQRMEARPARSMREGDLSRYRRQGQQPADASLKSFLSKLRLLRKRGSELASLPPEVIPELDAAIAILVNAITIHRVA